MPALRPFALLLLGLLLAGPAEGQEWDEDAPLEDPKTHESWPDYEKGLKLLERKRWSLAMRAFEKFVEQWPESPMVAEAVHRSGDNAYLGTTVLWRSGPSERRIDVAVMGDGFTNESALQRKQEKWADECIKVLTNEDSFGEYWNYFNVYFVRLASLEEGVDPSLSPEERRKIEEKNRYRRGRRKKKTDYSTALDAKAAGPQGQVMCDRGLVYKWLDVANRDVPGCGDDKFVIAFAQFGRLGMGGGGIANVGRPDKSVTTHEFGHAFSRLLDEYQGNPNPPEGEYAAWIKAANASTTDDPAQVPWAHMLKEKVKGVGIYEGGATYSKGVWRPARTCAMNAAGAVKFCPVCREATILVIYEHVNPIDVAEPAPGTEVRAVEGDETVLSVVPMAPRRHKLAVTWYVASEGEVVAPESAPDAAGGGNPGGAAQPPGEFENPFDQPFDRFDQMRSMLGGTGNRAQRDRSEYDSPPPGQPSRLGKEKRGGKGEARTHFFPVGKLAPGRYVVTAEVRDETKWVVKDEKHLLVERATWTVEVAPGE